MPGALRVQGHFGEWIQGRAGPHGPLSLITVCCPALAVTCAGAETEAETKAAETLFAPEQLSRFAELLDLPEPPAWPALLRNMPLGAGAGASTATLVALARGAGYRGPPDRLARACVAIEGASDPLMFDAPDQLIWQSRRATIHHHIAPPPVCEITGGFWGAPERTDPQDLGFADVSDLLQDWEVATGQSNLSACARLATLSVERCTSLRGPGAPLADPLPDLMHELGALGCLRAHTGSARGLIFALGSTPSHASDTLREAGLTGVLQFSTGGAV